MSETEQPEEEQEIVSCHACGAAMNITTVPPYSRVICPACKTESRVKQRFGPYVLKRRHAIGGMSSVFQADDEILGREVALKILSEEYSKDEKRIEAFENEARLTASFSHPNVVKVFTTGRAFGWFFIAMEFVPGGHFEHKIREMGKIPEAEALAIAIQIAEGLKGARSAGLIHRDIKPGNILFDSEGNAKIVDFGLALVTKGGKAKATEIWATPFYVPPEAIEGGVEDFRADIYAFGATIYHALAGVPPCNEESMSTSLLKAAKKKVVPLKKAAPELGEETCAVIGRTMAYDPADRYASYDEMIVDLKGALKAAGEEGPRTNTARTKAAQRAQSRARKKRGIAIAVGAGVSVLAVIAFAFWIVSARSEAPREEKPAVVEVERKAGEAGGNSSAISNRYRTARRWMEKGNFVKAEQNFAIILSESGAEEPTRTWAGLEAVVAALLDGRAEDARGRARAVERHIAAEPRGLEPGFSVDVRPVLRRLGDLKFFGEEALDGGSGGKTRFMGYLIAALKNWEQGGIEEAMPFLEKIVNDEPAFAGDGMLQWYQTVAEHYLSDYELLTSRPFKVWPDTVDECKRLRIQLLQMQRKLRTRGRAEFNVRARLEDLERLEEKLAKR